MMMVEQQRHVSAVPRIRRALALPIYAAALVLDVAAARAWPSRRMDRRRRLVWIDSPCMTLGRPLVSPGFGRCHGAGRLAPAHANLAARRGSILLVTPRRCQLAAYRAKLGGKSLRSKYIHSENGC
jgi:hypothetical protein